MSCLPDCGCPKAVQESTVEGDLAHDESAYRPLSESIPLLPKDTTMITYDADSCQYAIVAIIGKGLDGAAVISGAQHIPTGQKVAIRRIDLELCPEDVTYIQKEILIIRQLRHENILPYYCSFVCHNEVWSVMPLMSYGSARDIMYSHFSEGLPELAISLVLKDILAALDYVHKRGYIHRSVKASHILISSSGKALLSGLRYSCNVIKNGKWQNSIHCFPSDSVSNLNWLSPELLEQNLMGYNSKSDIYSLGITACELANGIVPFAEMAPTQMLLEKLQGYHPRPLDSRTFYDTDDVQSQNNLADAYRLRDFTDAFHIFTELCLQRDPSRRPTALQLSRHLFIKQCKKSNIALPDILATVTPISDRISLPKEDSEKFMLEDKLQELALNEPWNFDS
ncbi:STE20-related kinase adapter protein alpha [Parasteatoda tepidariorum]|uniref:STE20-related kinase adapter protein alpha n=1 Tax=Parasteatoda tepidariorum TaxID=114398 RepID=A0A2L2YFF2_PARTP|nr:STE20-related kinase adapter protein alpha [Parasteatoda tepidariorum]XP_015914688.1 STE20-related kinase adapter protein alpha [Parasteatoda tepidariorum]